jgi:redox-sensitive bicupin YhaK (pirin superfamily)
LRRPFVSLDHFGPIEVRPGEAKGASAHPHAGIETLTLRLEGRSVHEDSLGNFSAMGPGEVQWMRAGRGIIHDEPPIEDVVRSGGCLQCTSR